MTKEPLQIQLPQNMMLSAMEMRSGDLLLTISRLEMTDKAAVMQKTELLHITIPVGHREVLAAHIKP
jgi:hypothetical protein